MKALAKSLELASREVWLAARVLHLDLGERVEARNLQTTAGESDKQGASKMFDEPVKINRAELRFASKAAAAVTGNRVSFVAVDVV